MNKDIMSGNWKQLKGKVKQQWGKLTNDDLDRLQGTYEELEGLLQKQYGYNKERADKELHEFLKKH